MFFQFNRNALLQYRQRDRLNFLDKLGVAERFNRAVAFFTDFLL